MDTKSYLMGIFDGEGCVTTGKGGSGAYFVQASVTMASQSVCALFKETWGGALCMRRKPTVGGLILYTWTINSSKGVPFLEYAAEHSMVKREQAVLALEMARNVVKYSWAGYRKGVSLSRGARMLTPEDRAAREDIVLRIRAFNGARSRFNPPIKTVAEAT